MSAHESKPVANSDDVSSAILSAMPGFAAYQQAQAKTRKRIVESDPLINKQVDASMAAPTCLGFPGHQAWLCLLSRFLSE